MVFSIITYIPTMLHKMHTLPPQNLVGYSSLMVQIPGSYEYNKQHF